MLKQFQVSEVEYLAYAEARRERCGGRALLAPTRRLVCASNDSREDRNLCGEGADRVWRNAVDTVSVDCETVVIGTRPGDPEPIATPRPGPGSRVSVQGAAAAPTGDGGA